MGNVMLIAAAVKIPHICLAHVVSLEMPRYAMQSYPEQQLKQKKHAALKKKQSMFSPPQKYWAPLAWGSMRMRT